MGAGAMLNPGLGTALQVRPTARASHTPSDRDRARSDRLLTDRPPPLLGVQAMGAAGLGQAGLAAQPPALDPTTTTDVSVQGAKAAGMAAQAEKMEAKDGKKTGARDFSFLVTEDKQDSGPNLSILDTGDSDDSDDSDDEMEGEPADGEEESGFDAGSALDQLLWRQKAVSGMETRRPGESVQQFFQRRTAGMRMLKAEAGGAEAKALENEVDAALQASSTQWHWGQGDHDADLSDDEREIVKQLDAPKKMLELTWDPSSGEPPPPPPEGCTSVVVHEPSASAEQAEAAAALGGALELYNEEKARSISRRQVIGRDALIKSTGAGVARPQKDALSNDKLAPIESGRGFALLEKMGWKKGEGLGREKKGTMLPVEAAIKTDMGGLRAEGGEAYSGHVRIMSADGPELGNGSFSTGASSMLASLQKAQQSTAASMDSEFSSITTQTKSVQQINEENRARAAAGLPPLPANMPAPAAPAPPAPPAPPATPPVATPQQPPPMMAPRPPPMMPPRPPMAPYYGQQPMGFAMPPPPQMNWAVYGQQPMGCYGVPPQHPQAANPYATGYAPPAYPGAYGYPGGYPGQ